MSYDCLACSAKRLGHSNYCFRCGEHSKQAYSDELIPDVFGALGRFALRCPVCERLSAREHQYCGFDGYPFDGSEMEYSDEIHYTDPIVLSPLLRPSGASILVPGRDNKTPATLDQIITQMTDETVDQSSSDKPISASCDSTTVQDVAPLILIARPTKQKSFLKRGKRQAFILGSLVAGTFLGLLFQQINPYQTTALTPRALRETPTPERTHSAPKELAREEQTSNFANTRDKPLSPPIETATGPDASSNIALDPKALTQVVVLEPSPVRAPKTLNHKAKLTLPVVAVTSEPLLAGQTPINGKPVPMESNQALVVPALETVVIPPRAAVVTVVAPSRETLQESLNLAARNGIRVKVNDDMSATLQGAVNSKAAKQIALAAIGSQPAIARVRDVIFVVEDIEAK